MQSTYDNVVLVVILFILFVVIVIVEIDASTLLIFVGVACQT